MQSGQLEAVKSASLRVLPGKVTALVGESGSGKSVIAQTILGILPPVAKVTKGRILFNDPERPGSSIDLCQLDRDSEAYRALRGQRISMIFQEPMTSLSPLHTVGNQIEEALTIHTSLPEAEARRRTEEMLGLVGFPDPAARLRHLSVRIVRRPAAAGDDRHGADLPPGAADRRRAHHGAGRDDPGADPEADARAAARAQHGHPADHP